MNAVFSGRARFGSRLGLARMEKLAASLGSPQQALPIIHVAGTNGKGSTSAFLAGVLRAAGLKVGLFTSPHLVDFTERFLINGRAISPEDLVLYSARVERAAQQVEQAYPDLGPITFFEAAVGLALVYFQEQAVEAAVLEVGLGGRYDATNIVTPEVSVITPVSFDHMEHLGSTLAAIAGEKAGIIKQGRPVVISEQQAEAGEVLRTAAARQGAPIYEVSGSWQAIDWGLTGGTLLSSYFPEQQIKISLGGQHQLLNAATALTAVRALQDAGWKIGCEQVLTGMARTNWPGRLEIVRRHPLLLLDGAHNQAGIASLAAALQHELQGAKLTLIVALSENKPFALLEPMLTLADRVIFTRPQEGRIPFHAPHRLKVAAEDWGLSRAEAYDQAAEALTALGPGESACIFGSLYLIGEVKGILQQAEYI